MALAPTIARAYNFGSSWEENAPLSDEQHAAITALAQVASDRPLPSHLTGSSGKEDAPHIDEQLGHAAADFYKWYSDLESAMKSETEEKYRQYVNTLTGHLNTCDGILEQQLDDTLLLFDDLQMQHQAVATKTKTLHDSCDRLVLEKDRLAEFANTLKSKLVYFDELETIATQFYSAAMSVDNEQFPSLLKRLDDCIIFISSNPQYADSGVYLLKFKQLQSRAIGMMRSHVQSVMKKTTAQVHAALKEGTALSEGIETSVLYVRFKAAASEMKPLMEALESRTKLTEYALFLSDCQTLYCEQRLLLVQGVVQQRISEYAKREELPPFTRSGCAYLMQACQFEHQLFVHFFPSSSSEASKLASLTEPLCTVLYDALRPKFIHETRIDLLCELVDILKFEVLEEQLNRKGDPVAGLRPTIMRILADVQERLTFRVQTYVRNEVANYLPLAEDLDYPAKLMKQSESSASEEGAISEGMDGLYPPLVKTLACLSKLYRCLEPTIFTGLAQRQFRHECYLILKNSCTCYLFQRGSKLVVKKSSEMDGQLFLIKHLLVLREQITPFDIDFAVTHKELDFAHVLDHLRRILRGQASVFDFTSRTSLARTFSPRVLENQVDAKKELEKGLKLTCEQFIMSVTKLTVEPMLSFVTKVTAVRVSVSANRALKDQAFATPEKVAEVISKVDCSLKEELPNVISKMNLYLPNPYTRSILLKPMKSNVVEAYSQVLNIVEAEYSQDDIKTSPIISITELQAHLDSLG
ncbi:hypothetical protein SELMODRAFT_116626 [Selaginella moellendorffii]|uniref:Conserved oligomeric Golgi complex subunit 3 n=1 Tax=Selaginella moellendorffii TaxID=88036 RepID=D8SGL2_SELML|nr:hypothetical protein SELMODRAFT_116626 [Selaginella moellendorffii]